MDDNSHNIFEVLEAPSSIKSLRKISTSSSSSLSMNITTQSLRRSQLPSINAGKGVYSSSTRTTINKSTSDEPARKKRRDRALQDLGFVNPGPKNLVNVASVPPRRLKTRQSTTQEKPSSSKPLYDITGHLLADGADRCDCNHLTCPGCFLPCALCQSAKCGLECRNLRAYVYEYRLYGTTKEIVQQ